MSLSANGQFLVFAGYNVAAGTAGVAGAASGTVPRGIGTLDANGNYSLAADNLRFYSGNNIRGGASDGNGNFWGAGPRPPAARSTWEQERRLRFRDRTASSSRTSPAICISAPPKASRAFTKLPARRRAAASHPTLVLPNASPSDFAFNKSMTIAYVANTAGGIQRYDFTAGSWALTYTLDSATGMNGLAVDFSGANPLVYATTEDGKSLLEITDTGAGSVASTLASVNGTKEAFRGLEFTPEAVPEPSILAMTGLGLAAMLGFRRERKS